MLVNARPIDFYDVAEVMFVLRRPKREDELFCDFKGGYEAYAEASAPKSLWLCSRQLEDPFDDPDEGKLVLVDHELIFNKKK